MTAITGHSGIKSWKCKNGWHIGYSML